jgi:hypothetical protein
MSMYLTEEKFYTLISAIKTELENGGGGGGAITAGEAYIGRVGITNVQVEATVVRPTEGSVTAYSAKDVISDSTTAPTVITFTDSARVVNGGGNIVKARLFTNSVTAMLGATCRLHIYNQAPTAINDNAPMALLYANKSKRIGYIDFPALSTEGTGSDSSSALWADIPLNFKTHTDSKNLYGVLEVLNVGAAQVSAQEFYIALNIEQY